MCRCVILCGAFAVVHIMVLCVYLLFVLVDSVLVYNPLVAQTLLLYALLLYVLVKLELVYYPLVAQLLVEAHLLQQDPPAL